MKIAARLLLVFAAFSLIVFSRAEDDSKAMALTQEQRHDLVLELRRIADTKQMAGMLFPASAKEQNAIAEAYRQAALLVERSGRPPKKTSSVSTTAEDKAGTSLFSSSGVPAHLPCLTAH